MTKNDPKPIFFGKKNLPEQIYRKTSWKFILHPAPGNCGKERFTSGFPEGNPKCFMILVVFLASWWNLQKICIPNLPDVFFPMIPLLVQEAGQKKSQDPRDPFVMKGSIGLTIFGRSMSPAWKGGTCYIIFCWHCGVLVATVNCRMCCLCMFVMCKRIHILIYEGKYSTACTTPSNTFILTILENMELYLKCRCVDHFLPEILPFPKKLSISYGTIPGGFHRHS